MVDVQPFRWRRMLALRQFPVLGGGDLGELALLAENVTEVSLPAGTVVARPGRPVSAVHLVLAGAIATAGGEPRIWRARQVFGALEVLADRESSAQVVTTEDTTTLQLLADDVTDVLDDSFGVMQRALGVLAAEVRARGRPARRVSVQVTPTLGLVERLAVLRQQLALSRAPLEALVALAHLSDEVSFAPGAIVTRARTPSAASYVIVEGSSRAVSSAGASRVLAPGDAIGHLEMLGELPHDETVEATGPVRALALSAHDLFDVIEDHPDLGRAMLAGLARDLLDAPPSAPPSQGPANEFLL